MIHTLTKPMNGIIAKIEYLPHPDAGMMKVRGHAWQEVMTVTAARAHYRRMLRAGWMPR